MRLEKQVILLWYRPISAGIVNCGLILYYMSHGYNLKKNNGNAQ